IYTKPERQEDIKLAAETLKHYFAGKEVLEIACGTGFWTQFIAQTAKSIFATDINETVIEIAKSKNLPGNATFEIADMYKNHGRKFEELFGGFIFSHILKQDRSEFLKKLTRLISKYGQIVLMDNRYVEGSNHPITDTDASGNTYQTRKLDDGSVHKVLKNFPEEDELRNMVKEFADDVRYVGSEFFWILAFRLKADFSI
ncbi:MAG: class I SAM-dependent methyltransferase, partial [Bacteroidia bacterium]|nr:class I SAM-dependent methyltransferase [Bacteroidia bacterium]